MNLYQHLIDPDLYDQPKVAQFIDALSETEIQNISDYKLESLKNNIMPMDDINKLIEVLMEEAQQKIVESGFLSPQFIGYTNSQSRIRLGTDTKVPRTVKGIQRFLWAGKSLAFSRTLNCLFFSTMQPLENNMPVVGDLTQHSDWGILIIGSSLRGNCFVCIKKVINIETTPRFKPIFHKILREGVYDYPYSQFFHISDYKEMTEIIQQIPKLNSNVIPEKQCLINFATTLKALDYFR